MRAKKKEIGAQDMRVTDICNIMPVGLKNIPVVSMAGPLKTSNNCMLLIALTIT